MLRRSSSSSPPGGVRSGGARVRGRGAQPHRAGARMPGAFRSWGGLGFGRGFVEWRVPGSRGGGDGRGSSRAKRGASAGWHRGARRGKPGGRGAGARAGSGDGVGLRGLGRRPVSRCAVRREREPRSWGRKPSPRPPGCRARACGGPTPVRRLWSPALGARGLSPKARGGGGGAFPASPCAPGSPLGSQCKETTWVGVLGGNGEFILFFFRW